jgi:hypothetical protein
LQLVIGNNIHAKRGWTGSLHGLALFKEAISADLAMRRRDGWVAGKNFKYLIKASDRLLSYTFEEKSDHAFFDKSGGNHPLKIPVHLKALQKTFLALPGKDFYLNQPVVKDMLINVLGFIPIGMVFYVFLQRFFGSNGKFHLLAAFTLCVLLSISIEIAQADTEPVVQPFGLDVEYFRWVVGGQRDKGKIQISADGKQKIMR